MKLLLPYGQAEQYGEQALPAVPEAEPATPKGKSLPAAGVMYEMWSQSRQSDAPESSQSPELEAELDRIAAAVDAANAKSLAEVAKVDRESASQSVNPVLAEDETQESQAQESPRAKKSAAQQAVPDKVDEAPQQVEETQSATVEPPSTKKNALQTPSEKSEQSSSQGTGSRNSAGTTSATNRSSAASPGSSSQQIDNKLQVQTVEVLNNIDQAMGACAMNLSALQKIATEQTETMKALAETMQHQNFFEIGLNLNSVIESMSAALEPMKAVGELVPAIDQLVVTLESRSGSSIQSSSESVGALQPRATDDESRRSTGKWADRPDGPSRTLIWQSSRTKRQNSFCNGSPTFSALRECPVSCSAPHMMPSRRKAKRKREGNKVRQPAAPEVRTVVQVVQDEALLAELERLRSDNQELAARTIVRSPSSRWRMEEMQSIVEQMQQKLEQRETEFTEIVGAKDREIQEAQELLTSRWEEFNARYDELMETLHKRDELLAEKEAEIARKESENLQLKAQMEELRDQTRNGRRNAETVCSSQQTQRGTAETERVFRSGTKYTTESTATFRTGAVPSTLSTWRAAPDSRPGAKRRNGIATGTSRAATDAKPTNAKRSPTGSATTGDGTTTTITTATTVAKPDANAGDSSPGYNNTVSHWWQLRFRSAGSSLRGDRQAGFGRRAMA